MRKEKEMTQKLFPKEVSENKKTSEILDYYSRVSDIVERTYMAMGKKSTYRITSSSSTIVEKINTNAVSSTH